MGKTATALLLLCAAATSGGALVHGAFSAAETRALIRNWMPRPVHVDGGVHLLPGAGSKLGTFARAAILVNEGHGAFASLDGSRFNLYIHRNGTVVLCLWATDEMRRDVALARLRAWHEDVFPDRPPLAAALSGDDGEMWARD